jgi:hypothetical protein
MIQIRNSRVIAAIIECCNLPISKKCECIVADRGLITFIYDEYENPQITCIIRDISTNFEIAWWGPLFTIHRRGDIGHWEIDCTTGKSKWVCCYNREGKIKYGRYYESSMD